MLKPVQIVPSGDCIAPVEGVVNTDEISTVEATGPETMRVPVQNGDELTILGKPSDLIP